MSRRWPFDDGSFDRVFTEHAIEHVGYDEGRFALDEAYRVLKPGGRIRVSTPSLEFLFDLVLRPTRLSEAYVAWACGIFSPGQPVRGETVVNNFVRAWGHRYIYSREILGDALKLVGFRYLYWPKIAESEDIEFVGLENATRMPEGFLQLETMTVEGEK